MSRGWALRLEATAVGLVFPEAPTWYRGALWVSDVAAGGVHRIGSGGTAESCLPGRRGIGGMAVTESGDLLATGRDLVRVSDGEVVRNRPAGSTGLNDVGTDSTGNLYVGVLTYRPAAGDPPSPGAVARLGAAADDWDWWVGPRWPNGIVTLSDGVVVADFSDGRLWRHREEDGAWEVLAISPTGHADGLARDVDGRLWLATGPGRCVESWSLTGELLGSYPVDASFVSSVCFGGAGSATLFVTVAGYQSGQGAVLAAPALSPGAPVPATVL